MYHKLILSPLAILVNPVMIAAMVLLSAGVAFGQDGGKEIFQARCTACHNVNSQVVGPALSGIDKRRDINWITHFVHSSQTVIKGGDEYANALFIKFNNTVMPDQPDLTDIQIKGIVAYIVSQSRAVVEKPPFAKPFGQVPSYLPLTFKDWRFMGGFLIIVVILIMVLVLAVRVKEVERKKGMRKYS